jgi:hypothetical protein
VADDDDFLESAAKAIDALHQIDDVSYWGSPIPSPEDEIIAHTVDLYVAATPLQREVLRHASERPGRLVIRTKNGEYWSGVAQKEANTLGSFSIRMAMLAVRRLSEPVLTHALVALVMAMDWAYSDPRDFAAFTIPLLAHCALKIGADLDRLYGLVDQVEAKQWSITFLYRPDADWAGRKLLELSGYEEIESPAGVIYCWRDEAIPDGWRVPEPGRRDDDPLERPLG